MKKKFFGTDGIRGLVNKGSMTPEMLTKLHKPQVFIFKKNRADTLLLLEKTQDCLGI